MKRYIFSAIVILLIVVKSNGQCTYTLQPGPEEGKDVGVNNISCSNDPNYCGRNFGDVYYLFTMAWTHNGQNKDWRSFIEFDLSQLKLNGCNILSAKLQLSHSGTSNDHCGSNTAWHPCKTNDFDIKRVVEPWLENQMLWNNQPQVTNNVSTSDYIYVADSSNVPFATYTIDMTDMVSFWVAHPDSNFGFRTSITQEFDHYRSLSFASSDHSDASRRPKLIVTLDCDTSSVCNNIISGNIYDDFDQTCDFSSGDNNLEDWMVKIEPGPIYTTTDQFGNYSANVDMDNYTVTPIIKNDQLWNTNCFPSYNVNFTTRDTSVSGIDFPLQASSYCADLSVDIAVSRMRKCHNEWFKVEYCNKGNLDEDSVYIDVYFDHYIHPQSSTVPFTYNSDSSLRFFIDTLQAYECGFFTIETLIDCDVDFGITQCAEALIYPVNYCEPIDSTWDKSSVQVTGMCVGDSNVCFTILNTGDLGDGDMAGTSNWYLYEDGNLIQTGTFQLEGQETLDLCFAANSHTLQLVADQRPGHPGNSHPNEIIEACGSDSTVEIVSAISFREDDVDKHREVYCDVIRASYDPNEKVAKPMGVSDDFFIAPNLQMEYVIHFQNMGNDTAYLVVVKDTLPAELDPTTLVSGISSHNYNHRMIDAGVVEWRFENIFLVDSATNEEESKGYVKFKINQVPNLPHGTVIQNRAGIYFDFNAPVITEYAWNTIWDSTITSTPEGIVELEDLKVMVYPNPANETIHFTFKEEGDYTIEIRNMLGQDVRSIIANKRTTPIDISAMTKGIYIYSIVNEKGVRSVGKFIKE